MKIVPLMRFVPNFILSCLCGMLAALPVRADEMADVTKLLRAEQHAEALRQADAFLAKKPRDASMRFLKGVILTEQNKSAEAIALFTKLTEDFPDLPAPYNNLAVLFAANGQYEKARAALDRAIRTNPTYATAYENLGDVHAKMASQAYDKALQLDSGNAGAKSKLTLVQNLVEPRTAGIKVAAAPTPSAPVAPTPGPTAATTTIAATDPAKTAAAVKPAAEPAKATAKTGVEGSDADRAAVLKVVNNWASAWSAKDVKGYLSAYGNDFQTPNGQSRNAWAEERHARIAGKGRISVKVESPQVSVSGNMATVKFRQKYVSDKLSASSRKTLLLARHGSKWQIKQERTGS